MAEKQGLLDQTLKNDYNTAGVLEVFMNEKWYRVTSKDFRSFNGPRRITEPSKIEHRNPWVYMRTYEYYGPVFEWGSNTVIDFSDTGSLAKSKAWDIARKTSEDRG